MSYPFPSTLSYWSVVALVSVFYGAWCLTSKPSKSSWGSSFGRPGASFLLMPLVIFLIHTRVCSWRCKLHGLCTNDSAFPCIPEGCKGLADLGEFSMNLKLIVSGYRYLGIELGEIFDFIYLGTIQSNGIIPGGAHLYVLGPLMLCFPMLPASVVAPDNDIQVTYQEQSVMCWNSVSCCLQLPVEDVFLFLFCIIYVDQLGSATCSSAVSVLGASTPEVSSPSCCWTPVLLAQSDGPLFRRTRCCGLMPACACLCWSIRPRSSPTSSRCTVLSAGYIHQRNL